MVTFQGRPLVDAVTAIGLGQYAPAAMHSTGAQTYWQSENIETKKLYTLRH